MSAQPITYVEAPAGKSSFELFAALDPKPTDSPVVEPVGKVEPTATFEYIPEGQLATALDARQFIRGGNATFTLRSKKTGARFTYRVRKSEDGNVFFVSLLNGPDNETAYAYFGYIRRDVFFHGGQKAKAGLDAPAVKAFKWAYENLMADKLPEQLEIWHEGRCARCARKLTVPESVRSGFGPECITRV